MTRPAFSALASLLLGASALLAGCATDPRDIGREPHMTPVGAGLSADRTPLPVSAFPASSYASYHSLWNDSRADLFRDPRAARVGDILTVKIRIDDSATLDNSSSRKRNSSTGVGGQYDFGINGFAKPYAGDADGKFGITSNSASKGEGAIDRSERIDLSIAAVVTEVLPNGNLLISGSQEVRVNFELRILNISGIVRTRDISTGNTISYEKIAEARVSYGGRGRVTEVQQPGWGHQVLDAVTPF